MRLAKSLVALGTVAAIGAGTLTTSTPAAAQAWVAPVIVGSVIAGAFCWGGSSLALPLRPLWLPTRDPTTGDIPESYYQGYAEPYYQRPYVSRYIRPYYRADYGRW